MSGAGYSVFFCSAAFQERVVGIHDSFKDSQRYGGTSASIRVNIEDDFCRTIKEELEKRGFHGVYVPEIILKGDVDFSW